MWSAAIRPLVKVPTRYEQPASIASLAPAAAVIARIFRARPGGSPLLRIRIVWRNAHCIDVIDRDGAEDGAQDLGHARHTGHELEAHQFRIRPLLVHRRIVAIGDENFGMVPSAREDAQDVGMKQGGLEHGDAGNGQSAPLTPKLSMV